MTGEEFVKLCFEEKEAILEAYFGSDTQTEVGSRIRDLIQSGANQDALYRLLDLVMKENYYMLLLALDGETSLGGKQIAYKLYDEENNLLNQCGEIEMAAYHYFMEAKAAD